MRPHTITACLLWAACGRGTGVVVPLGGGVDPSGSNLIDTDGDGITDDLDNCAEVSNPDQADVDDDGAGDACDDPPDLDLDGVPDHLDNCAEVSNPDQLDLDDDGIGDGCDNCPSDRNTDQADGDGDGIGDRCPCEACGAQWCMIHPAVEGVTCAAECPTERRGLDGICCPLGARWSPEAASCLLADLHVDGARVLQSLTVVEEQVSADSCEIYEGCVLAPGDRVLLRFDTTTPNEGSGDLFLGDPGTEAYPGDGFVWSPCHQHFHFEGYADYQLLDDAGAVVAPGHKQAFCLIDIEPRRSGVGAPRYTSCSSNQGISSGWADTYGRDLDCQFVDITDVAPGTYTLRIEINYDRALAESDYSNNVTEVEVTVPQ
ncbi:MAG TPA: hypothetical protein ENK18_28445 [Deltaproteobacteria bacterium]|nr:hypothetical protein [Deltaproteobacteria bacterium]